MLSKYNGIFVALGFAATFLLRPQLRRLLRTPHPWLAACLTLATQAPVIWWNLTEGLASFRFHLADRWGDGAGQIHWLNPVNFILLALVIWSPFFIWPLIRLIRSKPAPGFEDRAKTLTVSIFAISTIGLMLVALPLGAFFYWNIVAFAVVMPLLTRFVGKWLGRASYLFGLLCACLAVSNFTQIPVLEMIGRLDHGSSINFGWSEIAEHVRAAEAQQPTDLIASTRYSIASQLGFALGTTDVVKLSAEHSQYDFWQDERAFVGKSALILTDGGDIASAIDGWAKARFDKLTQIDDFSIVRFGRPIYHWVLFRGENFHQPVSP
jgi:hypothetical protein